MKMLTTIASSEPETAFNALRLATMQTLYDLIAGADRVVFF